MCFKSFLETMESRLEEPSLTDQRGPSLCEKLGNYKITPIQLGFPSFGRLRHDSFADLDELAGAPSKPPLVVPIDLSSVHRRPTDIPSVSTLLRQTHESCILLSNQGENMGNSAALRFKLVQHVILQVSLGIFKGIAFKCPRMRI